VDLFWCRTFDAAGTKATGAALLVATISTFLSLVFGTLELSGKSFRAGGYTGEFLAREMSEYLARAGSLIVILTLIFLAVIMTTQFSFGRFFAAMMTALKAAVVRGINGVREWREERRRERQRQSVIAKHMKKGTPGADAKAPAPAPVVATATAPPALAQKPARPPASPQVFSRDDDAEPEAVEPAPAKAPAFGNGRSFAPPKPPKVTMPSAPPLPLSDPEPTTKAPAERRKGEYTLPPLALLDAPKTERKIDERELMDGARLLEEKCREFNVEGSVVQIHPGPVVTTFEFKPDAGVKYSKITGLADDLCLAMQAESVLIDRIPGKSTVGIQIPNRTREQISLREMLESESYRRSTSKLAIALGKTIHGEPHTADLATMPHLLIAGSTGAGKSVALNGMLTSILYRATPDDCADDHDRSEAARARHVRRHPAPDDAGRRRSEAGGQRPALGGRRDGESLQDAGRGGRPQHRAVQPQRPAGDHREADAEGRRRAEDAARSSSSSSTSSPT
jgi:S-DNA-T family DNA segregation ATPase FtsK/SpoIIIE